MPEIGNRLGWLTISDKMLEHADELREFVESVQGGRLHRRGPARHGGLEPRPGGHPALVRRHPRRPAPARARLDRPGRGARPGALASTWSTRCSSSRRSRAARSRRSRTCATSSSAAAATAAASWWSPIPGSPLVDTAKRARASGACSRTTRTSAGATRCSPTSGSCPAALAGVNVEALLSAAQVAEQNCAEQRATRARTPGLWLGVVMGELALQGRDKLTFVVSAADRELRPLGRAARGGVHRQARQGHPAGGGRAAGRPRAPTATTACSSTCATPTTPTRTLDAARGGAGPGRSPDDDAGGARGRRPRAGLLLRRVRDRRGRLGARHQPVRPAERAGGQGQHRQGAGGGRPARTWTRATSRSCSRPRGRRTTWRPRLRGALGGDRRRGGRAARGRSATRPRPPPRSATARATCTPPASCTRAGRRPACSSSCCTTATRTWRSRARATRSST